METPGRKAASLPSSEKGSRVTEGDKDGQKNENSSCGMFPELRDAVDGFGGIIDFSRFHLSWSGPSDSNGEIRAKGFFRELRSLL